MFTVWTNKKRYSNRSNWPLLGAVWLVARIFRPCYALSPHVSVIIYTILVHFLGRTIKRKNTHRKRLFMYLQLGPPPSPPNPSTYWSLRSELRPLFEMTCHPGRLTSQDHFTIRFFVHWKIYFMFKKHAFCIYRIKYGVSVCLEKLL